MSTEDTSNSKKQDLSKSERRPGEAFECLSVRFLSKMLTFIGIQEIYQRKNIESCIF